jgi:hypothetical protein
MKYTIFSTVKSTSSALGKYLSKNINICCMAVQYALLLLGAIAESSLTLPTISLLIN